MAQWFKDNNLSVGKITSAIPPGIIGIAGDAVRGVLGLGGNGGPTGPVRNIPPGDYSYLTSLAAFQADIRKRGIARSNRYLVMFYGLPTGLSTMAENQGVDFARSLNYIQQDNLAFITRSCEEASFPGLNIQTQEVRQQSYLEKMPTMRNYNETSWTFRCDNEMLEKKFFDMWTALIIDKYTGDVSFKSDYQVDAAVIQFNEHGKATYAIQLQGLYPTNVGDLNLSQTADNNYHRLPVSFAYSRMNVMSIDDPEYTDEQRRTANGLQSLSLYDRLTNDVFKQGKNVVLKQVNKYVPVGNVPGLGSARDILGLFGV